MATSSTGTRGAEKIKGYTEQEIVGRHFRIFYTAEDQANGLPDFLICQAREQGKAIHEGWRVRKDGTTFWGSIVITALHGEKGEIVGFSKVTRDLTERKVWEDKLRDYAHQLEEQNRELQQFAHVAAHDMKEPLRKIQYYHSLLLENVFSEEKQRAYLQRSAEAAGRMQGLIDDLLAFTRIGEPGTSFEPVDLNAMLREIWQFYTETVERSQAVLEAGRLPVIRGIPFQVRQLFLNLVGNSIKYRSLDRPLRMTVNADLAAPPSMLSSAQAEGTNLRTFHKITFSDNGIGFELEQGGRIFEMFHRLHRRDQYPGTGIGLAICRKVMDVHKGYIIGRGVPGEGAIFECYFPE
jgi:PAS domain S-box-containing protein